MNLKKAEDAFIGIPGKLKGISGGEKKRLAFAAEVSCIALTTRISKYGVIITQSAFLQFSQ